MSDPSSERTREDSGEEGAPTSVARLASPSRKVRASDPFERVYGLGDASSIMGAALGVLLACSSHVAALLGAVTLFQGSRALAATTTEIEIEASAPPAPPPKPEAPRPPEPPPPPPPPPKPAPPPKKDLYEKDDLPPPPPAEAAKVLTAPSKPDEPPAPAEQTFVSGEGTGLGVGFVSGNGVGGTTFDPRARVGNPAPTTQPTAPPAPVVRDLSRTASPYYGLASGCDFPDGADDDTMVVPLIVTVGPDGQALSVQILHDPGQGFGPAARACAMRMKWRHGLDAAGKPIVSKTSPVKVRFIR